MSDYEIGYGKPPRANRFKPGNQAAGGKRRKRAEVLSLSDVLASAITKRMRVKRGDELVTLAAGEIMIERLVRMMTSGTPREMVLVMGLIERHAPQFLAARPEVFKIQYTRAEGSSVELPPADLWDQTGP